MQDQSTGYFGQKTGEIGSNRKERILPLSRTGLVR